MLHMHTLLPAQLLRSAASPAAAQVNTKVDMRLRLDAAAWLDDEIREAVKRAVSGWRLRAAGLLQRVVGGVSARLHCYLLLILGLIVLVATTPPLLCRRRSASTRRGSWSSPRSAPAPRRECGSGAGRGMMSW